MELPCQAQHVSTSATWNPPVKATIRVIKTHHRPLLPFPYTHTLTPSQDGSLCLGCACTTTVVCLSIQSHPSTSYSQEPPAIIGFLHPRIAGAPSHASCLLMLSVCLSMEPNIQPISYHLGFLQPQILPRIASLVHPSIPYLLLLCTLI